MSCCQAQSCPRSEDNVFGEAVTDITVQKYSECECKCDITSKDRAEVALRLIQADGKREKVRSYVQGLRQLFGEQLSTPCMVYNATGDTLFFEVEHDWEGHNWIFYPSFIRNGQWGGFLHVATPGAPTVSEAAVVYRSKDKEYTGCKWLLAWSTTKLVVKKPALAGGGTLGLETCECKSSAKVYTEFPAADKGEIDWSAVKENIKYTKSFAEKNGCYSIFTVVEGDNLALEAILTLDGVI